MIRLEVSQSVLQRLYRDGYLAVEQRSDGLRTSKDGIAAGLEQWIEDRA